MIAQDSVFNHVYLDKIRLTGCPRAFVLKSLSASVDTAVYNVKSHDLVYSDPMVRS
tara:strand:- start:7473 stop:7640 length:168 start_codon:yes stop_codon:yes gene_type:complete